MGNRWEEEAMLVLRKEKVMVDLFGEETALVLVLRKVKVVVDLLAMETALMAQAFAFAGV